MQEKKKHGCLIYLLICFVIAVVIVGISQIIQCSKPYSNYTIDNYSINLDCEISNIDNNAMSLKLTAINNNHNKEEDKSQYTHIKMQSIKVNDKTYKLNDSNVHITLNDKE